ncbi:hypothetical protein H6H01_16595 [Nostoc calcicola FACHB-3891]|nr:hypothetical protein [Nostoc calcicola FACHB-3891]
MSIWNFLLYFGSSILCILNLVKLVVLLKNQVSSSIIAVPIQMQYNIISPGVGARQCRAPTGVSHVCRETLYFSGGRSLYSFHRFYE